MNMPGHRGAQNARLTPTTRALPAKSRPQQHSPGAFQQPQQVGQASPSKRGSNAEGKLNWQEAVESTFQRMFGEVFTDLGRHTQYANELWEGNADKEPKRNQNISAANGSQYSKSHLSADPALTATLQEKVNYSSIAALPQKCMTNHKSIMQPF